jgi:hypothetical protein
MPPEWMPRWRGAWGVGGGGAGHRQGDVGVSGLARLHDAAPAVDLLGPGILLAGGVAERLGHVAHRGTAPVGDDVGDLGGVAAAVALVDVLDHLLTAARLDVDVDVGGAVALGGQEALEEQAEGDGVGLGDAEGEAHRGVGRRAAALAIDAVAAAELDDVPDDEEVAGEAEVLDDVELVVDLRPRTRDPAGVAGAVAVLGTSFREPAEEPHLVEAVGTGVGRQVGSHEVQVEGAVAPELASPLDHSREAGEAAGHLGSRAQVGTGRRR